MWQYLNAIWAIKVVAISTTSCILCNREKQLKLYNLQKDVISTQKQPSCKKGAALCKMAGMKKKLWNTGGGQEMADGRSVTKF